MKFLITIVVVILIAMNNLASAQNNPSFATFIPKADEMFSQKADWRNAAVSNLTLQDYSICVPLVISLMASEVKGAQFKKETVAVFGILFAGLNVYRQAAISRGIPESTLESSMKPYHQEFLRDGQTAFNKYAPYCQAASEKFVGKFNNK